MALDLRTHSEQFTWLVSISSKVAVASLTRSPCDCCRETEIAEDSILHWLCATLQLISFSKVTIVLLLVRVRVQTAVRCTLISSHFFNKLPSSFTAVSKS